ncbi:UPF0329 protein ECU05_1680/ECU11_0050-like [Benincasa hispida]|uniref:UPF0329 protein ECU05_1680/ECU11_0050-like n=1 Tax=Benincasa hispida TaxID=102211 RepID=UPI0019017CCA|nr:UPF0329 protein ECU05_1680/ECU11_0050-like [Benincasa hispida]
MEKEGRLPEAGVVNQPLPSEEKMEEATRRSALAVSDPKEVVVEKQPEMAEEKKKTKNKEKKAEGDEEAQRKKEKKDRKSSDKRECRQEGKRLKKKEEKRKRAESPEVDEESTTTKVDEGVSVQQRKSAQLEEESMQIKTTVTDNGEDPDITPLMWHHKENAPQGQRSTYQFCKVQ